ncbi:MAG TPA: oligogalacturonate lyase family protein, partial [Limnochordia bacterium]|nr:oligogalacturonate lyase family protein [Limnochordia bacterium]
MKPKRIPFQPDRHSDPETGRQVTRLFPAGQVSSHAYFTSTSFDAAGNLILSAECDGKPQLCRVAADLSFAEQLTDLDGMLLQSYCVSPAANLALVRAGDQLLRVELESGEAAPVFKAPEGWRVGIPTVDAAGTYAAFVISERPPGFTTTARIYSTMPENFFLRPRSLVC